MIFSVTGLPETIATQRHISPQKKPPLAVNALNVRRECIPNNNLSVVLWVDEDTRQRLPYDAKDLWAFRTETRFFRDAAAHREEHLALPSSSPGDTEIAGLRDLLRRYQERRPDDSGVIADIALELGGVKS